MTNNRFVDEYQKNAVLGASPVGLVVMLYDGALRFMETGKHYMAEKNLERQNHFLQRAQKIVIELMTSLDMDRGADISVNLQQLYGYVLNQLVEANIYDSTVHVDRCIKVFSELREAWVIIDEKVKNGEVKVPVAA